MKRFAINTRPRLLLQSTGFLYCCLRLASGLASDSVKRRGASDTLPRLYVGPQPANEDFCGIAALSMDPRLRTMNPILSDSFVQLSKDQSHYLNTVLRRKKKQIRLFDGSGEEWLADIAQEGRDIAMARPREKLRAKEDSPTKGNIWLCFPPIKKRDRMRWLIEKTTELGCTGYIFLDTDHSERTKIPTSKLFSYAVEASEQCERSDLPRFVSAERPVEATAFLRAAEHPDTVDCSILVCRERSDATPLLKAFEDAQSKQQLFLLIGPEGGWSPQEEEAMDELQAHRPEMVVNVSLGPRILRAETASISALAAHQMFRDALVESV